MRFVWIHRHREEFPVNAMCGVLKVSRSGYYATLGRPPSARRARREELVVKIKESHAQSRGTYGSPRVWEDLKANHVKVSRRTVEKYMREEGVAARPPRRFVPATTDARHDRPVADNLLNREFTRIEPNTGWVSDITYIPTAEGWLFLAVVIDLFSRRVVGHATAENLKAGLALDALEMALTGRSLAGAGLLHHSDRGVQYLSIRYTERLADAGIELSVGSRGDAYDNALAETVIGLFKTEVIRRRGPWRSLEAVEFATLEWVDWFNHRRLLELIGCVPPAECEARYYEQAAEQKRYDYG